MNTHDSREKVISPLDREKIQKRAARKKLTLQEETLSKYKDDFEPLEERLSIYQSHLVSWEPHYDFQLWNQIESYFEQIWPKLSNSIYLAIEYGLYEKVKSLFFDVRHLLQTTGRIKERIYLATWIRHQAEKRQDTVGMNFAISSLVWSYTSSGKYQDLDKATELWRALAPFLSKLGSPHDHNEYRRALLDEEEVEPSLYTELLMDIYEGGVRLAVRQKRFQDMHQYIKQGRDEISILSSRGYLSSRLKVRFDLAFSYHRGVACYLKEEYGEASKIFDDVIYYAELISWTRAVKGAKSWLATIAIGQKKYDACEAILLEITETYPTTLSKRDGMCHLIKAQLLSERGEKTEKAKSEQLACRAFSKFTDNDSHRQSWKNCDISFNMLYSLFSLAPCPG